MAKIQTSIRGIFASAVLLLGTPAVHAAGVVAPHFALSALDGERYTDQYLRGHPSLVVFWASWCPVCQVELPKLHALFDDLRGRGLQVLAIGFADDEERIRHFVHRHADIIDFPVLYDQDDIVAKRYGVVGTPTVYLVNKRGEIVYMTWLIEDPKLEGKLDHLLNDLEFRERRS